MEIKLRNVRTSLAVAMAVLLATAMMGCKQVAGDNAAKTEQTTNNDKSSTDNGQPVTDNAQPPVDKSQQVADDEGWSFATVPLPQGGNPPRFVSNPDGVLSPEAEAELNRIMLYAMVDLKIEGCIVAVKHVANSDVDAFAYALFDGFDHNERMLVIVLAYDDHGVRMELGHDLEAEISEVECQQMLNNIMIPYLREGDPDEGMLSLVEGVYKRLESKQKKQ